MPFLLITAILALSDSEYFFENSANAQLLTELDGLDVGFEGVGLLAAFYPPITHVIALIVPGGVTGLAVLASLQAGYFLQRVVEWGVRQSSRVLDQSVFLLLYLGVPMFAFLITTNLEVTLGIGFFALAMIDLVRFVVYANTQAGFRAGLLLAGAALSAPAFTLAILISITVTPFLVASRRGSRSASAFVIAFPTIGAFGTVALLLLVFGGRLDTLVTAGGFAFDAEALDRQGIRFSSLAGWLYFVPTVAGMALALILGRPVVMLLPPVLTASTLLMTALGITPTGSSGIGFFVLIAVTIAMLPRRLKGWRRAVVLAVGVSQIIVGWLMALLTFPATRAWCDALVHGWWS
ncbi:MAG: hypothetical protein QM607_09350 [Microbacterium sp.]